jgi:hypothetical protein
MRNVDIEDFGGFERYGRGKPFDKLRRKPSVGSKVAQSYSPQTIEERYPESSAESERLDSPDVVHVGDVLFIADKVWRIDNPKSEDHPGVCGFAPVELGVPFLQGTDERNLKRWYRANYLCIPPIQGNGLKKPTAFNMEPKWLRLNTVKNYYPQRLAGRLDNVYKARVIQVVEPWVKAQMSADTAK